MASEGVQLRDQLSGSGPICRQILGELPIWFGIPAAVEDYVAVSDRSPAVIASLGDEDVGIFVVRRHNPFAAEVYVMAVLPLYHRRGIGRRMISHAEHALASEGVEFLQVKTLSASRADEGYERTRQFYLASGFRPPEELPELWDRQNPALLMIKSVHSVEGLPR
jgi:GNAT superfamily N-acetyltransferase